MPSPLSPLLLHLAIVFAPTPALSPDVIAAALTETGRLWAPYGVDVRLAPPHGPTLEGAITLTVVAGEPSPAERRRSPNALAGVGFDVCGRPRPQIAVYAAEVVALIAHARVLGASETQWPQSMRDRILGRAVGRVLAHEIGHFVLGTREHAARGLMRAAQGVDDLVTPERVGLGLSAEEVAQLLRVQRQGPAHAAGP
jgi:hypothetical protein